MMGAYPSSTAENPLEGVAPATEDALDVSITFCHNCDGGMQELGAASEAVKAVVPNAKIANERTDDYPIEVEIKIKINGQWMPVWKGSQKKLFRKYYTDRCATQKIIVETLQKLLA